MPVVSQAQRRWAYATAEGKTDAPVSVGKEFVEASHGIRNLPERKKQHGARSKLPGAIAAIAPMIARTSAVQYGPSASKRHIPQEGARMQSFVHHPHWGRMNV